MTEPTTEFLRLLDDPAAHLLAYFEERSGIRDDAAVVLADVLLRAWRRAADLPADPTRRRIWLFTVAANVLADRHHVRRRAQSLVERIRPELSAPAEPDHTPGSAVRDALRLHTAQRELVILIQRDGLSIVEAATILGLDTSMTASSYAAAREHLRQALVSTACG
jgi:RNA polymerase sigma-70 factor, ECF subfamily